MPMFSAHLGYLFDELPLAERFAAARRAGFGAVEHPAPYAMPATTMRRHLDEQTLRLVQIALPAGDAARGEKGMAALPGREAEFGETLEVGIAYAMAAGADFIQVQSGLVPADVPGEQLWATYLANLARATERAAQVGLGVLIEPIGPGTLEGYFMGTSALALRAWQAVKAPNLGLLFDVFHEANAGGDPIRFVAEHIDAILHLHIADWPGRHQPGTGQLDFPRLFRTLAEVGYIGAIGCEYKPRGSTAESLGWLRAYAEPDEVTS
jgi:hydroxypyruvate isomerase